MPEPSAAPAHEVPAPEGVETRRRSRRHTRRFDTVVAPEPAVEPSEFPEFEAAARIDEAPGVFEAVLDKLDDPAEPPVTPGAATASTLDENASVARAAGLAGVDDPAADAKVVAFFGDEDAVDEDEPAAEDADDDEPVEQAEHTPSLRTAEDRLAAEELEDVFDDDEVGDDADSEEAADDDAGPDDAALDVPEFDGPELVLGAESARADGPFAGTRLEAVPATTAEEVPPRDVSTPPIEDDPELEPPEHTVVLRPYPRPASVVPKAPSPIAAPRTAGATPELDDESDEFDEPKSVARPAAEASAEYELARPEPQPAARQGKLFAGSSLDQDLIDEARELVVRYRRASANFLRRRLRVSAEDAAELMAELARRGVIERGEDAEQGRVILDR